jgi:hypothetical protein
VGVLAWRVGGGGGACAKKVAAGREIGKEKRARGEGGEESDDGGEVMQSYDRNGERMRSGAGADAWSEEAWGEGRQTRGSGWKGGRDFVSSSFFLVVEKYVVLRATPILSVKNEKPCRFTLPTGSQNCPLAIRLAFSPRPLAFFGEALRLAIPVYPACIEHSHSPSWRQIDSHARPRSYFLPALTHLCARMTSAIYRSRPSSTAS